MRRRNNFSLTLNSSPLHTYLCHQINMRIFRKQPRKTWNWKCYRQSSGPVGLIPRTIYQNLLIFIWPFPDEITCFDGLLFKGQKVIVTASLWKEMLNCIHSSHLGIVKCPICAVNSKRKPKETLMEAETSSRPWSIISAALNGFQGYSYLLCVDHFSKWPEFSKFENQTSGNTILHLTCTCSRYGIPDKFINNTDNGPQFSSEAFRQFSRDYGFVHTTTSPHFP